MKLRIKTEKQLLFEGWKYDRRGNLRLENAADCIVPDMLKQLGKFVKIKKIKRPIRERCFLIEVDIWNWPEEAFDFSKIYKILYGDL